MLYIVTEDSNSGRYFWKIVFATFLNDSDYELVEFNTSKDPQGKTVIVSGNNALDGLVDKALLKAKTNDSLFVALDAVGTCTRINQKTGKKVTFDYGDFVNNTTQKCKSANVNLYLSSYYCFEEIYLSYIELEHLVAIDSKLPNLAPIIKYVRECIDKNQEYYDRNRQEIQDVIKIKPDAATNKEHFADALLMQSIK